MNFKTVEAVRISCLDCGYNCFDSGMVNPKKRKREAAAHAKRTGHRIRISVSRVEYIGYKEKPDESAIGIYPGMIKEVRP